MGFTYLLVATLWSFIGVLVAVSITVNRNKEVSFMGPVPVSYLNQSVYLCLLIDPFHG